MIICMTALALVACNKKAPNANNTNANTVNADTVVPETECVSSSPML